jgi:hypothetical protein
MKREKGSALAEQNQTRKKWEQRTLKKFKSINFNNYKKEQEERYLHK